MAAGLIRPTTSAQILSRASSHALAVRQVRQRVTPQMAQNAAQLSINRPNYSPGLVSGLSVAGITPDSPELANIDERVAEVATESRGGIADTFDDWVYDPFKSLVRSVFLGLNAGVEELESLTARTGVAAYQGEANPLAAAGRSDMWHAATAAIRGEEVNLGDGFFPQSTLAPDVADRLAQGESLADATAGSMTQQELGAPITAIGTADRERLQITSRGGTSVPVSMGRLAAITVAEPGSNEFHYLSGMGDFAKQIFLDPADLALGGYGQVRKLRKMPGMLADGRNAGFVAKTINKMTLGGDGRKTWLNRGWSEYLNEDVGKGKDGWVNWFVEQEGEEGLANIYDLLSHSQKRAPDINMVEQILSITGDQDNAIGSMRDLLETWGKKGGIDTKFRGGIKDIGPGQAGLGTGIQGIIPGKYGKNVRENGLGFGIRNNLNGTYLGRLANATNSKALNVMDGRSATEDLDTYIQNLGLSESRRNHYLHRAITERGEVSKVAAAGGETAESKGLHAFYYGLVKDITGEFIDDAKKAMGPDSPPLSNAILDKMSTMFNDMDGYRAYWLNGVGDDMVFGGARFTTLTNGAAQAQPSAITISQFMEQAIPLVDSRKVRATLRRSDSILANNSLTSGVFHKMFGVSDYNKLGNNVVMNIADGYVSKLWKPSVLLRVSWPMRVIGEEQLRLGGAQLAGAFNHPMQFLSVAFMHRYPALQKFARMSDDVMGNDMMSSKAMDDALTTTHRSYAESVWGEGATRWEGKNKADMSPSARGDSGAVAFNQLREDPIAMAVAGSVQDQMRKNFAFERGMTQAEWDELLDEDIAGLEVAWDKIGEVHWDNVTLDEVKERFYRGDLSPIREMLLTDSGRWNNLAIRAESDNYIDTIYALIHQSGGGDGRLLHTDTGRWYALDGVGTDPKNPGVVHKSDVPARPDDPLTRGERLTEGISRTTPQMPTDSPRGLAGNAENRLGDLYDEYTSAAIDENSLNGGLHAMVEEFSDVAGDTIPEASEKYIHDLINQKVRPPNPNGMDMALTEGQLNEVMDEVDKWMQKELGQMDPMIADSAGSARKEGFIEPPIDYNKPELMGEEEFIPHKQAGGMSGLDPEPYSAVYTDAKLGATLPGVEDSIQKKLRAQGKEWDDLSYSEQVQMFDQASIEYIDELWQNQNGGKIPTGEDGPVIRVIEFDDPITGVTDRTYLTVQPDGTVSGELSMQFANPDGQYGVAAGEYIGTPLAVGDRLSIGRIAQRVKADGGVGEEAFLRMQTGGETVGDYFRSLGLDIDGDATTEDIIRYINSDPDAWPQLAAQQSPRIGVSETTHKGSMAERRAGNKPDFQEAIKLQGQHRPGFEMTKPGDSRYWEMLATGEVKADGFKWGSNRTKAGAQRGDKSMQKLHAQRRDYFGGDDWFDSQPQFMRVASTDPADAARQGVWDKGVNYLFSTLMSKPTNFLSRSPAFKQFYWRRVAHMYQEMDAKTQKATLAAGKKVNVLDDGTDFFQNLGRPLRNIREASGRMTAVDEVMTTFRKGAKGEIGPGSTITSMEHVDELAKAYALEETKRLLYDLSNRHNWSDQLRIIMPFAEAWFEVGTTWGRLMKENPRNIRRMQQALQGGRDSDPFSGVEPDGEQGRGLFFTDEVSGEEMFAIPGMDLVQRWMPFFKTGEAGENINFAGRLSALNITAQVIPGLGPLVQIPVSQMGWAEDPDFDWLQEIVLPYGKSSVEVTNPTTWLDPTTPKWVQQAFMGFTGKGSDDNMRLYHNTVIDVYKTLLMKGYSADTEEEMVATLEEASKRAKAIYRIRAMASFLGPTSQTPSFEVHFDAESDLDGQVWAYQNLATAYREIQDMNNGDEVQAFKQFTDIFGIDPMLFAVSKTTRTLPKAVTIEGRKWQHDNEDLFQQDSYELTAYYSHPDPIEGEFDYEAYLSQLDDASRVPLTPEQWALKRNQFVGRIAYNNLQRQADRVFGTDPQGTNWLRQQYSALQQMYPGYGQPIVNMPAKPSLDAQIEELHAWEYEPRLSESPVGQSLSEYLGARQRIIQITMYELGYQTETSFRSGQQAALYRAQLRRYGERLVNQNPDFLPLWEQVLLRELDEPESSLAPVNLAGVEF